MYTKIENRKFCSIFFFPPAELEMPFWRLSFAGVGCHWEKSIVWGKRDGNEGRGRPMILRVWGQNSAHSWTFLPFWKRNKRTRLLVSVRLGLAWSGLAWSDEQSACQVAQEFSYYSLHAKPLERVGGAGYGSWRDEMVQIFLVLVCKQQRAVWSDLIILIVKWESLQQHL